MSIDMPVILIPPSSRTVPFCYYRMLRYLGQLGRAVSEGIPVIGYQHWSIMDNFEWAEGYDPRFGLIYVDYATGKRIVKDSAWDYKKIIETNGAEL